MNGWDGTNDFAPDMEVSREQLAKMIANYANKIAGANTAADQSNLDIFDDADAISPWARDAVAWCAQAGVLTGSPANGSNNALAIRNDRAATAKISPSLRATFWHWGSAPLFFVTDVLNARCAPCAIFSFSSKMNGAGSPGASGVSARAAWGRNS